MILVDTSVWIDHLRRGDAQLTRLLNAGAVLCHPFVIGELACGNLHNRAAVLALLEALPVVVVAAHGEVLHMLEVRGLSGEGLGWVDAHLLASALIAGCPLRTRDRALARAAGQVGLEHDVAVQ